MLYNENCIITKQHADLFYRWKYNEKSLGFSKAFLVGAEGVEPPTLCL